MLNNMPRDPMLLLSVLNTKLRDFYPSLDLLCKDLDLDKEVIIHTLQEIDYEYDSEQNQFI